MSQQQFQQFVAAIVPSWRRSQHKVLALCVRALLIRRRCTLSALARALPATCHVRYRLKRLARFMDNPRLKLLPGWDALAQRAAQLHPTGWLPMLLDDTGLRDHATVLSAAVPYQGRALPIACLAFSPSLITRSLWALREGLIWRLSQGLGEDGGRMVVVADRAFAASHFFRWLKGAKVHFVVRVSAKVYVQWPGLKALLSQLEMKPGCRHFWPGVRYGPKQAHLNLLVVWRNDCTEPWLIASSLDDPKEILRLYGLRMRIEAFFKDGKEHFDLELCRLQTGARICVFCFALSLAFWWLALCAPLPPNWESQVRIRGKLSWLTLAFEWLNALLLQSLFDAFPDLPIPLQDTRESG
jgi:hypothetical protein